MDAEDETWWLYRLWNPPNGGALDANAKSYPADLGDRTQMSVIFFSKR